jgi:membrane dipeptidase
MHIIDAHCDALSKFIQHPDLNFDQFDPRLDCSLPRLQQGNIKIQWFAIYCNELMIMPHYGHIKQMIDVFTSQIIHHGQLQWIKNKQDVQEVMTSNRRGAILTLEGVGALQAQPSLVHDLFANGVRFIGITWNYANWAADGVFEPRNGGFTLKGRELLVEMDRVGMLADVSHLSVSGFWELSTLTTKPFIASHSNAKAVCTHSRNLSDDQIKLLIERDGRIGITFVPEFCASDKHVKIKRIFKHIDHICALGGEKYIGFGSDFDGFNHKMRGLEHAGQYRNLAKELEKYYTFAQIEGFLYRNWERFLNKHLVDASSD